MITPAVRRLRDELDLPGMLVLQFAFDPGDPHGPHRFENHTDNRVIYTGTHDHDTLRGWYESLDPTMRERWTPSWPRAGCGGARTVVAADPARVLLAGAARDDAGAGRARARQRGADELPLARERELALAAALRSADAGARAAPARDHRGGG